MHTIDPVTKNNSLKTILNGAYNKALLVNKKKWLLDLRIPLSKHEYLGPLSTEMMRILKKKKISQVAGRGFGSFCLVGAIISKSTSMSGALIRDVKKKHGRRKRIEGSLNKNRKVFLIDDIYGSGDSIKESLSILKRSGYNVAGAITVFDYRWRKKKRLPGNFQMISLADLRYK